MNIKEELFKLQDKTYQTFTAKLIPTISLNTIIGVKTPMIKDLAKQINKEDALIFLKDLPHTYQEENLLHAILLNKYIKDIDTYITYLNDFLPYVNNWAISDTIKPNIFKKNLTKVHSYLLSLLKDDRCYIKRFAIVSFLQYYLDDNFSNKDLEIISSIKTDNYYVNMAISWYLSYALIKQYEKTIYLFEKHLLSKWINNKAISKAIDSYCIDNNKKEYLKSLKIK